MTHPLTRASRLDLDAFARATSTHPDLIRKLVTLGLLDARQTPAGQLWFAPGQAAALARIKRLQAGFALNYAALGLVVDLLDRISGARGGPAHQPSGTAQQPTARSVSMDPNHLTQKSQEALHDAQTKALRYGHTEVDGEHLLLALLDQPEGIVPRLLAQAGADPDRLRNEARGRAGAPAPGQRPWGGSRPGQHHPAALPRCLSTPSRRRTGSRTSTSPSSISLSH